MTNTRKGEIIDLIINEFNREKNGDDELGICLALYYIVQQNLISSTERNIFKRFLYNNKPTEKPKYNEFRQNEYWIDALHWWRTINREPKTKQIRIDFLKKLKSNLK